MSAAQFLARRNDLLLRLDEVDADIDRAAKARKSLRSVAKLRSLFADREVIVAQLDAFGIEVPTHPSVWSP